MWRIDLYRLTWQNSRCFRLISCNELVFPIQLVWFLELFSCCLGGLMLGYDGLGWQS